MEHEKITIVHGRAIAFGKAMLVLLAGGMALSCSVFQVRMLVQGDESTVGSSVVVDGRAKGVMKPSAGKMPDIYAGNLTKPQRLVAGPGYAECDVRLTPGQHSVALVSPKGDTLCVQFRVGDYALVRASFAAGGIQGLEGS